MSLSIQFSPFEGVINGEHRAMMASEIDERSDARETAASTSQSNFKHESGQCSLLAVHCLLLIEASPLLTRNISRC